MYPINEPIHISEPPEYKGNNTKDKLNINNIKNLPLESIENINTVVQFIINNKEKQNISIKNLNELKANLDTRIKSVKRDTGLIAFFKKMFDPEKKVEYQKQTKLREHLEKLRSGIVKLKEGITKEENMIVEKKQHAQQVQQKMGELSEKSIKIVNDNSRKAKKELPELPELPITFISRAMGEFIKNENSFLTNLEEIRTYKNKLDDLIANPEKLDKLKKNNKLKIDINDIRKIRDSLNRFIPILNVIAPFVDKIKDLKVEQFPEFAQCFLETDFTPFLDTTSIYEQFNELIPNDRKAGDEFFKLFRSIREESPPEEFKVDKNTDIDTIVSGPFQRIGRYPLTLKELTEKTPKDSSLHNIGDQCVQYAKAWAHEINEREKKFS